ncbi:MAG: histidine kinase, partial [Gemmatimonadaceae bacterium]
LAYFVIRHQHALVGARERALRVEALAQEARLEALRLQINPHFLFNTLNAISTLVVEHRSEEAARMIARLSDFLRLTLSGASSDEVTLADELDFVQRYLEIERVRFGDRLNTTFDIDDGARRVRVPFLILQPLVENAVRYAIVPREDGRHIVLSAKLNDGALHLTVCDDGLGTAVATATTNDTERRQIGLANTPERLAQHYGDRASFALRPRYGGGTIAEIILPAAHHENGARIA